MVAINTTLAKMTKSKHKGSNIMNSAKFTSYRNNGNTAYFEVKATDAAFKQNTDKELEDTLGRIYRAFYRHAFLIYDMTKTNNIEIVVFTKKGVYKYEIPNRRETFTARKK